MDKLIEVNERLQKIESLIISHKAVLNFNESVKFTGLSKSYLYKLTSSGEISHYKPNGKSLSLDAYVNALKKAASFWAVPLIDLYSISGLYLLQNVYSRYFENAKTDMLHPNSKGNYRLAKTIQYQLMNLPSDFIE